MKRNSDIASLFEKHVAKKAADVAATSNSCSNPVEPVVEEQTRERVIKKIVNPKPPPPVYDIDCLPHDPSERRSILKYPVNDQDTIRRAYIAAQERYIGFKNLKVYYSCIHK